MRWLHAVARGMRFLAASVMRALPTATVRLCAHQFACVALNTADEPDGRGAGLLGVPSRELAYIAILSRHHRAVATVASVPCRRSVASSTESCTVAASADRRVECRSDRMPHLRARQHNDLKGAAHAGSRGGAEERIGVVWLARRARVRVWAVRTCCPHDQAIICSINHAAHARCRSCQPEQPFAGTVVCTCDRPRVVWHALAAGPLAPCTCRQRCTVVRKCWTLLMIPFGDREVPRCLLSQIGELTR